MTGIERLRAFLRSPHHAWLGLMTLGGGLAVGNVPGLIVGAAAYALGWVFLPDSAWFKKWAARKGEQLRSQQVGESSEDFLRRRDEIYHQLSAEGRRAYDQLARTADSVRARFGSDVSRKHVGRLGQLVWTFLRLLLTKETLTKYLKTESSEAVGRDLEAVEVEAAELANEVTALETEGKPIEALNRKRLLQSKESRLESLRKRREHVAKAESDLAFTLAEIDRIHDAVRLIEADLVARRDPESLAGEIDRATSHFTETHDWLRDLEFDHTPSDIPDEVTATAPLRVAE